MCTVHVHMYHITCMHIICMYTAVYLGGRCGVHMYSSTYVCMHSTKFKIHSFFHLNQWKVCSHHVDDDVFLDEQVFFCETKMQMMLSDCFSRASFSSFSFCWDSELRQFYAHYPVAQDLLFVVVWLCLGGSKFASNEVMVLASFLGHRRRRQY